MLVTRGCLHSWAVFRRNINTNAAVITELVSLVLLRSRSEYTATAKRPVNSTAKSVCQRSCESNDIKFSERTISPERASEKENPINRANESSIASQPSWKQLSEAFGKNRQ